MRDTIIRSFIREDVAVCHLEKQHGVENRQHRHTLNIYSLPIPMQLDSVSRTGQNSLFLFDSSHRHQRLSGSRWLATTPVPSGGWKSTVSACIPCLRLRQHQTAVSRNIERYGVVARYGISAPFGTRHFKQYPEPWLSSVLVDLRGGTDIDDPDRPRSCYRLVGVYQKAHCPLQSRMPGIPAGIDKWEIE